VTERTLVAYRGGDLVDMCYLGAVRYRFVVWFSLGTTKRNLTVPKLPISTKSRFRYATSVLSVTFLPLFPFYAQFYILITAEIEDKGKDT